jgi:hypothetical protein
MGAAIWQTVRVNSCSSGSTAPIGSPGPGIGFERLVGITAFQVSEHGGPAALES